MKINRSDFKDSKVYDLIEGFFDYWLGEKSPYTEKTRVFVRNKYRFLPSLFFSVSFDDINESFFCRIYDQIEQNRVLGLNTLVFWICENKMIDLKNSALIIQMKDRLLGGGSRSNDVPFLFSDKAPVAMLTDPEAFRTTQWAQLFFFDITELDFVHDDLKCAAAKYCDYIKVSSDRAAIVKLKDLYNIRTLIQNRFIDKDLSYFTQSNIRMEIIQPYYNKQGSYHYKLHRLSGFLIWLCENGYITDPELLKLIGYKNYVTLSVPTTKQLRRLLDVDHLDWNCIVHIEKKAPINTFYYLNSDSKIMRDILEEYLCQMVDTSPEMYFFTTEFEPSFGGRPCMSPSDLNYDSFTAQISFFQSKYPGQPKFLKYVVGIYTLVASKYAAGIFDGSGIPTSILNKRGLWAHLYDGYQLIPYNPFESVPESDRWLLCYPKQTGRNQDFTEGNSAIFDFTGINDPDYRYYAKYYVWHDNSSYSNRKHLLYTAVEFFNYITDIKAGTVLTIYTRPSKSKDLTLEEILAYKTHIMNSVAENRTRNNIIYGVRKVLMLLEESGVITLPAGAYYHLRHKLDTSTSDANPIPKEELSLIADQLQKNTAQSGRLDHALYELVFYLGIETEFRISQILSLSADCVKPTSKPDEYVILSKIKVSGTEEIEQPITIYTKRHIDEILKLTASYRDNCLDAEMKDALFLVPAKRKRNALAYLKDHGFNKYLHSVCDHLGIQQYSFENVRDTHMTLAEEFQIRKGLSEMERTVLTGHIRPKSDLGYIGNDIRNMLEAVHGMIIGNIDVVGNVIANLDASVATTENEVSHRCGYCSVNCTDMSYLDCLMCESFTTTINRLPFFDERLKQIDALIENATIQHDKEDYVCIKRLLLAYKEKLLELQANMEERK